MKVLIYGDIGGSGGYHRYCKGLFGSGFWIGESKTVFCSSTEFAENLGCLDSRIDVVSSRWMGSNKRILRYLWHLWGYPRLIRLFRPDVEFYPSGGLRDFMRHPRCITVCHNLLPFDERETNRYKGKTRENWLKFRDRQMRMYERSSGVIFLSDYSRELVTSQSDKILDSVVIPHGIDNLFRFLVPRTYELSGQVRILYISPVYQYKHQCELVQAVQLLRNQCEIDIQLRLVGGGTAEEILALQSTIQECGGAQFCELFPYLAIDEIIEELTHADLFVFASSCEAFAITLVEAMGARLPIACSNRSGLPDILRDAGVYFDPEVRESIADALNRLIVDSELRRVCGELAYTYSNKFTWERCANETADFLRYIALKNG